MRMALTQNIQRFWHNHAGARWLVPMMALLAVLVGLMLYMLVYPYTSA
jgi:hypothetical protein